MEEGEVDKMDADDDSFHLLPFLCRVRIKLFSHSRRSPSTSFFLGLFFEELVNSIKRLKGHEVAGSYCIYQNRGENVAISEVGRHGNI